MEQELPAGLGERQIAEFIQDDEVEAGKIIGEAPLTAGPSLGLEPVDQELCRRLGDEADQAAW